MHSSQERGCGSGSQNGAFCVNVLREDQSHISESFAGRTARARRLEVRMLALDNAADRAPRVVDALVAFDCRVIASERVGSHFVVFGSVQDIFVAAARFAHRCEPRLRVPQRFQARVAAASARNRRHARARVFHISAP